MPHSELRDTARSTVLFRINHFLQRTHWPTLLSGLALGLALMQVLVARTVTTHVDQLAREVNSTRRQMAALAGSADDVGGANDLLARLGEQRQQIKAASDSIAELRRLRTELSQQSRQTDSSLAAIAGLNKLQQAIVSQRSQTEIASQSIAAALALQSRIRELADRLPAQAEGVAQAETALTQLAELKQHALEQQPDIAAAQEQLNSLGVLIRGLASAADRMLQARTAASELVAIKDLLTVEQEGLDRSQRSAEQLIALNDMLSQLRAIRIDEAQNNLLAMVKVQDQLAGQTRIITESVQNLDLLTEFETVLNEHLGNMGGLRRQLTDLILMESTMARAAQALAPLAQLGNLKNLNDQELREAARVILDRRTGRMDSPRMASGPGNDVQTLSSPDEVFDSAARPAPLPPTE